MENACTCTRSRGDAVVARAAISALRVSLCAVSSRMPALLLMLAVGLALLSHAQETEARIALTLWCAVVALMGALAWRRRVQRRRAVDSAPSPLDLDLDQRRQPPDR